MKKAISFVLALATVFSLGFTLLSCGEEKSGCDCDKSAACNCQGNGGDVIVYPITKGEIGSEIFKMNVKFHALSDEVSQVSYYSGLGFGGYNVTRENYEFVGLEYNGNLYTYKEETNSYGALPVDIIASGEQTVDVTAVWECVYPSDIIFNMKGLAYYTYGSTTGNLVVKGTKDNVDDIVLSYVDKLLSFSDVGGENHRDVNENIFDYFINKFSNIQTANGDSVVFKDEVSLTVEFEDGIMDERINIKVISNSLTFAKIFENIASVNGTLDKLVQIDIRFMFEVVETEGGGDNA